MARGRSPSQKTRLLVWGRAAGRCQYLGCSKRLDGDLVTGDLRKNHAYLAHIVASDPGGERGNSTLSHLLADDPENLMLMCDPHHTEIDDPAKLERYSVEALHRMKRDNEERIARVLSNPTAPAAHILRIAAMVGDNEANIPIQSCVDAMVPELTVADRYPIDIRMRDMTERDGDPDYYRTAIRTLRTKFEREIKGRRQEGALEHLAVFAIAPQPVLMELGRLLSDLSDASVYGRHREPMPGWVWPDDAPPLSFSRSQGRDGGTEVALKLSVTAAITDDRVRAAMPGRDPSIWEIRSDRLGSGVVRNRADLPGYRLLVGRTLDEIAEKHGPDVQLSVFPAAPIPLVIDFGRIWQPKAHPGFDIFDALGDRGFVRCHRIGPRTA